MPRIIPSGLATWLNNYPLLETHSTLQVALPFSENADTFYYATLPVTIGGQDYRGALKTVGELKLSMGKAADRVEAVISNEDGLQGPIFFQAPDVLRGNVVKIGRLYFNPQDASTQHHVILFVGVISSFSVDDTDIRLSIVSDLYGGGMTGARRLVSPTCQFKFKDEITCGYVGAATTCDKLFATCEGYNNKHHFGGALFKDSKTGLQTVVGGPPPVNQLIGTRLTSSSTTLTNFKQRTKIVFEGPAGTVVDDEENDRTIVKAGAASIEGAPIQVVYIRPDNTPGTDAGFDYTIDQHVARASGGFFNTVEAINVQTYGMVSDFYASGSAATATASINSGTDQLTFVTSVGDFRPGHGIAIPGARTGGLILYTTILGISGLVATLADNAGATVSNVTVYHDDTDAIQAALTDATAANCRTVFVPSGTYNVRGLVITGEVHLVGESRQTTIIYSTTNAPIIDCVGLGNVGGGVRNILVRGSVTAGSSQIGIRTDDPVFALGFEIKRCRIEDCGSHGLAVYKAFSSVYDDILITNCVGYPVLYDALHMPMNVFRGVYPSVLRPSAPAAFRIKAGEFYGVGCNGINGNMLGSKIAVIGKKSGVDGDSVNMGAFAEFHHCNFESYHSHGIHCYSNSAVSVKGYSTIQSLGVYAHLSAALTSGATTASSSDDLDANFWPASGGFILQTETSPGLYTTERILYSSRSSTQWFGLTRAADGTTQPASHPVGSLARSIHPIPIEYEVTPESSGGLPSQLRKGTIDSQTVFADGPEIFYWKRSAIHANDIPPLLLEGEGGAQPQSAPLDAYFNKTRSRREMLLRADGTNPRLEVTLTAGQSYSLTYPGTRFIAVKGSGAREIRLPYAGYYQHPEPIFVVDEDNTSAAGPITITGNGGTVPVGGAAVLQSNGAGVVLLANPVAGRYEIIGTTSLPTDLMRFTGGGKTEFLPIFTNDNTITSGPIYRINGDTLVSKHRIIADIDDSFDVGGDGFNRFRDFFAARKFKGPAFITSAGNGVYGGSGAPEGVQTAEPGSIYLRSNGTWYKKNSGSGNTGWVLQGTGATTTGTGLLDFAAFFTSDSNISNGPIYRSGTTVFFQGNILPQTTNTQDIGSSGFQWRTARIGTSVICPLYQFPDGLTISAGNGSPEGVVSAFLGSLYLDDVTGTLYRKASGFSTTGWVSVGGGSFANLALSNLSGVAINASLIADSPNALDLGSASVQWRDAFVGRDLSVGAHIITSGGTPSVTPGIGAGSGASASVTGNDICGLIQLTCGPSPAINSTLLTVTFAVPYSSTPKCVTVTAANSNAGNHVGRWFTNAGNTTTTQFALRSGTTALASAGIYQFYYEVKG